MKKKKLIVLVIAILFVLFGIEYCSFRYNAISDSYDFTTLKNVYFTLGDILDAYKSGNPNELLLKAYFRQLEVLSWYARQSPHIHGISFPLSRMARFDYKNLSKEQLDYLVNVHKELGAYNEKINLEFRKAWINRIVGVFRRSNVNELKAIFNQL